MAYGANEEEATRKVKPIALQVLADMIESGEDLPEPLKVLCGPAAARLEHAHWRKLIPTVLRSTKPVILACIWFALSCSAGVRWEEKTL